MKILPVSFNQKKNPKQQAFSAIYVENPFNFSRTRLLNGKEQQMEKIPFYSEISNAGENIGYLINSTASKIDLFKLFNTPDLRDLPIMGKVWTSVKGLKVFVTGADIKRLEEMPEEKLISYLQTDILHDVFDLDDTTICKYKDVKINNG